MECSGSSGARLRRNKDFGRFLRARPARTHIGRQGHQPTNLYANTHSPFPSTPLLLSCAWPMAWCRGPRRDPSTHDRRRDHHHDPKAIRAWNCRCPAVEVLKPFVLRSAAALPSQSKWYMCCSGDGEVAATADDMKDGKLLEAGVAKV